MAYLDTIYKNKKKKIENFQKHSDDFIKVNNLKEEPVNPILKEQKSNISTPKLQPLKTIEDEATFEKIPDAPIIHPKIKLPEAFTQAKGQIRPIDNQKQNTLDGPSILEYILIVLIIAVLVAIGYYVVIS